MIEGQPVITYITTMKEFRNQLKRMGEMIPDSTHTVTLLRNVPESWRPIAQTIRMIMRSPDDIEERLEAHEADLSALEVSIQARTAFTAQTRFNRPLQLRIPTRGLPNPRFNTNYHGMGPRPSQTHPIQCNNCGRNGHPASRCYAHGGGLAGQAPWRQSYASEIIRPNLLTHINLHTLPNSQLTGQIYDKTIVKWKNPTAIHQLTSQQT